MKTAWVKGVDNPQEIKQLFKEAFIVRQRLATMLEGKTDAEVRERMSKASYTSPSWSLRQADSIGYCRALSEVISLLSEGKDEN